MRPTAEQATLLRERIADVLGHLRPPSGYAARGVMLQPCAERV